MSRTAEVTLAFAGEDRQFRLPIGRLRALQEKVNAGPMELLTRLAEGTWRVDDLRETLYQALLGGGLDVKTASGLMRTDFEDLPLHQFVVLAKAVLLAAVMGAPDEDEGESQGEAVSSSPSPMENSASPAFTEPELS